MNVVRGERLSESLILQVGFVASVAIVIGTVLLVEPAALSTEIVAAGAISLAVLAIVLAAPGIPGPALIAFPLADMVAGVLLRHAVWGLVPTAGMIVLLPLLWLAYAFRRWGLVLALVGTVVASVFAFRESGVPETALGWARLYLLPALSLPILVSVSIAASRFRTDREIHDTEERIYGVVTEAIGAGVARVDAQGRPVALNEAAVRFAERAGLWGRAGRRVQVFERDRQTPTATDRAHIASIIGGEGFAEKVYWLGPPGDQVAIAATGRPLTGGGMLIVAHDVTELMYALESKEQIVRTIGHELKTPLTSIIGYADLIRGDVDDAAVAGWLEVIERKAHDLSRAIDDVLDAGRRPIEVTTAALDLGMLLAAAAARAQPAASAREVSLTLALESAPDGDLGARVDPVRFAQLVDILIENAVLFNRAGGRVSVTARRDGDGVLLEIADTGVGMSPGELSRAADVFYRTAYAEEQAVPGIGLGLSIAARIARAHGASLVHASEPGAGTTATVRMPAA